MCAPVDLQRICSSVGGSPAPASRSARQRVSRGAATSKVSSPTLCRGGKRTWAGSAAPGSFPVPSPASPTQRSCRKAAAGAAPGVCKLLSPCLRLPGAREGFTLPPLFVQ